MKGSDVAGNEPYIMWSTGKGGSIMAVADLDGDGSTEVIVWKLGGFYVLNGSDGSVLKIYSGDNPAAGGSIYPMKIGDLDGDGGVDIVFISGDFIVALDGETLSKLWVVNTSIVGLSGPYSPPPWEVMSLGDFNGDGVLDVVSSVSDRYIHRNATYLVVLNGVDGSIIWVNHIEMEMNPDNYSYRWLSEFSVGDLNGDGFPDIFTFYEYNGVNSVIFAFNGRNGSLLWKVVYPNVFLGGSYYGVLGDVDGDGRLEIVTVGDKLYVFNGEDGSVLWSQNIDRSGSWIDPALVDVDGDGVLDVVLGDFYLYAFKGLNGSLIWEMYLKGDFTSGELSIGDLDGDNRLEIVVTMDDSVLNVFNVEDGSPVYTYMYRTYPYSYTLDGPILGDLDGDGELEAVVVEMDGLTYAFDFPSAGFRIFWQCITGDLGFGTRNARVIDGDGDGLSGYSEGFIGSDPLKFDSDGDGLSDLDEFLLGTDPLVVDSDGDGLPDGWEVRFGFDPVGSSDSFSDSDFDGLSNLQEFFIGTDPRAADSDGDSVYDGFEVATFTDPLNPWDNLVSRLSVIVLVVLSFLVFKRRIFYSFKKMGNYVKRHQCAYFLSK